MNLIKTASIALLLVIVIQLCGCSGRHDPEISAGDDQSVFVPVDIEEGSAYFKDFDGNVITLKEAPGKVASFSDVATEILCGLGAGRYITVMNESSAQIEGAPMSASVLPDNDFTPERIAEFSPQIVFYSESVFDRDAVSALKEAGLTPVRIPEKGGISDAEANIRFISSLMYKDAAGERVISEMRSAFEKIKISSELIGVKKTLYIENSSEYEAIGGDSIISELCEFAGAENVFKEKNGLYKTSAAELRRKNPDVIIVLTEDKNKFSPDSVRRREGLTDVYAVRIKAIYAIDINLATRPTQNITKAMKSIGESLKIIK